MEDANSQPPLGMAPLEDTSASGAEPSSENGAPASSEETVHPDGQKPDGDGSVKTPPADVPEPFYKEGDQVFATKEDYFAHVNKQRGAASRLAHDKKLAEENAQHYETLYRAALNAVGKPNGAAVTEPEMPEETKAAMDTLKKAGFLTADQAKAMVDEAIKPFRADSEQRIREKVNEARQSVDDFVGLNPDAADRAQELETTLINMERGGIPGGLDQAYYLVTGHLPKTNSEAIVDAKREVKQAKAAQAGGVPSGKGGAPEGSGDIFDSILGSNQPSFTK